MFTRATQQIDGSQVADAPRERVGLLESQPAVRLVLVAQAHRVASVRSFTQTRQPIHHALRTILHFVVYFVPEIGVDLVVGISESRLLNRFAYSRLKLRLARLYVPCSHDHYKNYLTLVLQLLR